MKSTEETDHSGLQAWPLQNCGKLMFKLPMIERIKQRIFDKFLYGTAATHVLLSRSLRVILSFRDGGSAAKWDKRQKGRRATKYLSTILCRASLGDVARRSRVPWPSKTGSVPADRSNWLVHQNFKDGAAACLAPVGPYFEEIWREADTMKKFVKITCRILDLRLIRLKTTVAATGFLSLGRALRLIHLSTTPFPWELPSREWTFMYVCPFQKQSFF